MKNLFRSEKVRWFFALLCKDVSLLIASLVVGLLSSAVGILMAVFSQKLIDNIIPSKDMLYFGKAMGVLVALLLFRLAVGYAQNYISALHGKRFNLRLIDAFFSKMIFLPKSFFDIHKTGTLITRMHDSSTIHGTVIFVFNVLILNFLNLVISTAFLFSYSSYIGFLSFLALPLYFLSSFIFKDRIRSRTQAMFVANGENESNYIASIQNVDLIKTHNKQQYYAQQNFSKFGNSLEKGFQTNLTGMIFGLSSEGIGTICYIMVLGVAAYEALVGRMTIGEFTATLTVATGMLGPMSVLGNALVHLQGARVAFDRVYEIVSANGEFHIDEDTRKELPKHIQHIEFKNVCFSYESHIPLLHDINFSVKSGELICVFGRNGVGKSTLLNLLVALYRQDSGDILINGKSISDYSIVGIRDRIAIVSQQTKLFDGSLMHNICLSTDEVEIKQAFEFLNDRGFGPFINRINSSYHAHISEDGNNLSGGQKQIIALARALYKRPDVLLVDEATSALDNESEEFVIRMLHDFTANGGIVVMVSHRLKPARASSKIVIIDKHTVQEIGDHDSLLQTKNLYSKRYLSSERKNKSSELAID